jgi:hypothetical protein
MENWGEELHGGNLNGLSGLSGFKLGQAGSERNQFERDFVGV